MNVMSDVLEHQFYWSAVPGRGMLVVSLKAPANWETFRGTCFLNNVSATMFPRLRGPLEVKLADFGLT